jgi:hypothetical protein
MECTYVAGAQGGAERPKHRSRPSMAFAIYALPVQIFGQAKKSNSFPLGTRLTCYQHLIPFGPEAPF